MNHGWLARPICFVQNSSGSPKSTLKLAFVPRSPSSARISYLDVAEVVTVSLIGGLGNQMFQYAAGKALATRHGVPLALDISGFRNYALRPFLLDRLRVPEAASAIAAEARAAKPANHYARSLWRQRIDRVFG